MAADDETNPTPSAPPQCDLPHCEEPAGEARCTGTTPHYMCDSCFCGYASAQFVDVGAFEQERTSNEGIVSAPGELPCFLFLTNECDCASIPITTLARVLGTDQIALEAYEAAKKRLTRAQDERDAAEAEAAQAQRQENATPIERLRQVVEDALSRGGYVACPACKQHSEKDDACMHMRCSCGTAFCYCCGRRRGDGPRHCRSDGSGCDSPSAFLENHPGWGSFNQNDETRGLGALHEFHRRRMAYFLRQVKANQPPEQWAQLREQYPNLLSLNDGRRIRWEEIDEATPPLFGATTVDQLKWESEGVEAVEDVYREQLQGQDTDPEQGRDRGGEQDQPSDCTLLKHPLLILWIMVFVLTVILLAARAASDSETLRIIGNLLIILLVATGMPTVAKFLVDKIAANNQGCIQEVQCLRGRRHELPYLATDGRWSNRRDCYWYMFFGCIALASLCLVYKDIPALHAFGITLLTATLLFYTGLSVLVNVDELPTLQPRRSEFKHSMIRLCIFGFLWSVGIGLLTIYDARSTGNTAGKVLFAIGFAGALAELIPRANQAWSGGRSFIQTPDKYRTCLSYLFCFGLAVGSLMVALSDSRGIGIGGIVILVVTILGSCAWHSSFVQNRPLVRT